MNINVFYIVKCKLTVLEWFVHNASYFSSSNYAIIFFKNAVVFSKKVNNTLNFMCYLQYIECKLNFVLHKPSTKKKKKKNLTYMLSLG